MAKKKRAKRATIRGPGHDLPSFDSMQWVEPDAVGEAGAGGKKQTSREARPKKPRQRRLSEEVVTRRRRRELPVAGKERASGCREVQLIVEIILRQRTREAERIGTLRSVRVGERVRIDGQDDWVITRSLSPAYVGGPRRVICERRTRQRRAV